MIERSLNLVPASVMDYRALARRRLPRQIFDYLDGGAFAEATMAANVADLAALHFRQRVLRDVSTRTTATTVLGQTLSMPMVLAPVGFAGLMARRAEAQAARAAAAAGVAFCESTLSVCDLEEVAAASGVAPWFQLYVMKDRGVAEALMARAAAVGVPVLVLTVDLPVVGQRYRDARNGVSGSPGRLGSIRRALDVAAHPRWVREVAVSGRPLTFGNLAAVLGTAAVPSDFQSWVAGQFDPTVTWSDIDWVRAHWSGPLVVKGILDPDDAREAVARGVDGLIVSNHGGRQLDSVPSTIEALPRIVEVVDGRAEVLMDGGIRSGLDVMKALARGARAVMVGRAWAYAVAGRGERGVAHVLKVMREEIAVTMGLTGLADVADASPEALVEG
ncbi:MAG TPA: L-lactate dehydrogenase [Acidimicrobiales bacterium]|nr:L-lactate dehydrogenase [Acidimicrobiales bacterium]